jgi:hypothetical protein
VPLGAPCPVTNIRIKDKNSNFIYTSWGEDLK